MAYYGPRRDFTPADLQTAERFLRNERGWSKGRVMRTLHLNRENFERLIEAAGYVLDDTDARGAKRYVPTDLARQNSS